MIEEKLWEVIDQLAKITNYSTSSLAKKSGLEPTALNKSKRKTLEGKATPPRIEVILAVLQATNTSLTEFAQMVEQP